MLKKIKNWVRTKLRDWLGILNLEEQLKEIYKDSKFLAVDYGSKDFTALCYIKKGAGGRNDVVDIITFHPNIPHGVIEEEIQKMAKEHGISRDHIYRDRPNSVSYVREGRAYNQRQGRLE